MSIGNVGKRNTWTFFLDVAGFSYTVRLPDGSDLVINKSTLNDACDEYINIYLGRSWPQIESDLSSSYTLRNPLEAAFYDVFVRMSPAGYNAFEHMPQSMKNRDNYHINLCLNIVGAINEAKLLQDNAASVNTGLVEVNAAMKRINAMDTSPFEGGGWFEYRWLLMKKQVGINSSV